MIRVSSLRRALLLATLALGVAAGIVLVGGVLAYAGLQRRLERDVRAAVVEQRAADEIVVSMYGQLLAAHRQLRNPQASHLALFDSLGNVAYGHLRQYLFQPLALAARLQVETMKEFHDELEVEARQAIALMSRNERAAAQPHIAAMEAAASRLDGAVSRFVALRELERTRQRDTQAATIRVIAGTFAVVIVALAISALLLLRTMGRSVVTPLANIADAAQRLGSGDLSVRLGPQRHDELATVASSFNAMAARLEAARAEVEAQRESLALSEARYREVFAASPLPMCILDSGSQAFLEVNDAAVRQYGYSREEFARMTLDNLQPPRNAVGAGPVRLPDRTPSGTEALESRHVKKGGDGIDVEVATSSVTVAGRPALLMICTDITERKLLQRQVQAAQRVDSMGRLAGGIAHDFNNLLTVIVGYCTMLAAADDDAELRKESVEEIQRAAERAAALTRQLLAFGRRQVLNPQPLNLNTVIAHMENMISRLASESVEVKLDLDPDLGLVEMDAGQLEQVIVNLVVNARDAMPNGGVLTISTAQDEGAANGQLSDTATLRGPRVMFAIRDTGIGMDEYTKSHAFEPFFTTKEVGRGTGLGLASVQGIVKQSGGHIEVESAPGRGTTFRIHLPRAAVRSCAAQGEGPTESLVRGCERILVAEDDAAVRAIVTRTLTGLGYSVAEARDGLEALEYLRGQREPPHLVITDVVMPKVGGSEVVAELRRSWPEVSVLVVSGYSAEAAANPGMFVHGASFLAKPFTPMALAGKVRSTLDARQRSGALRG